MRVPWLASKIRVVASILNQRAKHGAACFVLNNCCRIARTESKVDRDFRKGHSLVKFGHCQQVDGHKNKYARKLGSMDNFHPLRYFGIFGKQNWNLSR